MIKQVQFSSLFGTSSFRAMKTTRLLLLLLCCIGYNAAHAQTTTYTVTVAATGASGSFTTGYVNSGTVTDGNMTCVYNATATSNDRAFAVFNLSSIPSNAVITSASLTYSVTAVAGTGTATYQAIYGYAGNVFSSGASSVAATYSACVAGEQIYYNTANGLGTTTGSKTIASSQYTQNFIQGNIGSTVSLAWISTSSTRSITISGETAGAAAPTLTIIYQTNNYNTVPLASSSFNYDLIANGTAAPSSSTTAGSAFGGGYDFLSGDYRSGTYLPSGTDHLPAGGKMVSLLTTGLPYQFANYTGSNALFLNGAATSGTLTFTTPQYASKLYILGTGANTPTTVSIVATYADASTQTFSGISNFADWYTTGSIAMQETGRVNYTSGSPDGYSTTTPYLHEANISLGTYSVPVSSLTITNTANQEVFFAVTAQAGSLTSSVTSLSAFGPCTPTAAQTFSISGAALYPATTGSITATAPTGFQVSTNGTTWGSTALYQISSANTLTLSPVYVRLNPASNGTYSGNITFSGGTVNHSPTVTVTGTASGNLLVTPSTGTNFGSVLLGTPSSVTIYTLTAASLAAGTITVTSTNPTLLISPSGTVGTYTTSYTFANSATVSANVYAQFTPTVTGVQTGTVSIAGTAISCAVANTVFSVTGVNPCVTNPSAPAAINFSGTTAVATSVSITPTGTPDGYLLVEGTTAFTGSPTPGTTYTVGASLGSGTVVASSYTTSPVYNLTGLTGNTTYYFTSIPFYGGTYGSCSGGPLYPTGTQTTNTVTTCPAAPVVTVTATVNAITINWASATGGGALPVTYSVGVYTNAAYTGPVSGFPLTTSSTSVTATGLTTGVTYYYRLNSITSGCTSGYTTGSKATATYCTPTFSGGTGSCSGYYTSSISFGGVNWTGSSGACATSNYTAVAADVYSVVAGVSSAITIVTQGYTGAGVWIDFNNDGTFNDAGEGVYLPAYMGGSPNTYTGSITVPTTVATGTYRMRVLVDWATAWSGWTPGASQGPCSAYSNSGYGTYQDFSIYIQNPILTATTSSLSPFGTVATCGSSSVQTFSITGSGLVPASGNIVANAPAGGFLVSTNGTTWGTTATYAYTGSALPSSAVYVEFAPTVVGTPSGNITFTGSGSLTAPSFSVTGTAAGTTVVPAITAIFGPVAVGSTSSAITYTLTGSNLAPGTITVSNSTPDFQVSPDGVTWYAGSYTFSTGATLSATPIYIQYSPTVVATETTTITVTSPTGCVQTITANGNGAVTCTAPGTPTAISFPSTTSTGTGITFTPSGTPDGYLVLQGSSAFSGTPVTGTNYAIGNTIGTGTVVGVFSFSPTPPLTITSSAGATIAPNTGYYITVIPFNGGPVGTCTSGPLYATSYLTGNYTTCPVVPTAVTSSGITGSSFVLSWTAPVEGSADAVSYGIDVTTDATFATGVSSYYTSALTYTVPVTYGSTVYYYRLHSITAACNSGYTTPGNITTGCGVTPLPYSQGFESITAANTLPSCMAATNLGGANTTWVGASGLYNQAAHTGNNYASFYYYNNSTGGYCNDWFFTPEFNFVAGYNYQVSFWYVTDGYSGWLKLNAGYGASQTAAGMTTTVGTPLTNVTNTTYAQYTGSFTATSTGNNYVGIYCNSNSVPYYLTIDDILVQQLPTLIASPTSVSVGSVNVGYSGVGTYSLSGSGLSGSGNVTITAPANYKVSTTSGSGYASSITVPYSGGLLSSTAIYVQFSPTVTGTISGTITCTGGGATASVPVTGVGVVPVLAVTPSTVNLGPSLVGVAAPVQTFSLSGAFLLGYTGNITLTSTNPVYLISTDDATWLSTITVPFYTGTLSATPIYVQFTPTVTGSVIGSVTLSGGGAATTPTVTLTGSGANPCSTPTVTPSAMVFTGTSATGTSVGFTATGTAPDAYLLIESTVALTSGPVNTVDYTPGSSLGGGTVLGVYTSSPSYAVTGLTGNTQYYFTVYPLNGGTYGTCGTGPLYGTSVSGTVTTCPTAPTISTVTSTVASITLNWASSGNALPVTYTVGVYTNSAFTGPVAGSPFTVASPTASLTVTGLSSAVTYYYKLNAATSVCTSAYVTGSQTTNSYCTPTFSGGAGSCSGYYTSNVTFGGVNWTGTSAACGTSNFTAVAADVYTVTAGVANAISITDVGYTGSAAWIDYNNDGTFNDAGEGVFLPTYSGSSPATYTGSVTVPTTVATGTYRMRVLTDWATAWSGWTAGASQGPCSAYSNSGYGAFQDFSIIIKNPQFSQSVNSLASFGNVPTCGSSSVQIFTVSGTGLAITAGSVTATAPAGGFQLSLNGSTWSTSLSLPYTAAGTLTNTPVYVSYIPSVVGSYSGIITFTGGFLATSPSVSVSANTAGTAIAPASTAAFGPVTIATTSAAQTYSLTGSYLTPGTTTVATSNPDFQISLDGVTYYTSSYSFGTGASISDTPIYIVYSPTVVGTETATITVTNPTGCVQTIVATGSGANPCATPSVVLSSIAITGVTSSAAIVGYTASGSAPDGYLLIESTVALTSSPVNSVNYTVGNSVGGGTVIGVYSSSLSPSYAVSGLTGNTQYYFTLVPFNGGTTGTCGSGPLYGASLAGNAITCVAVPTVTSSSATSSGFNATWTSSAGGGATSVSYVVYVATVSSMAGATSYPSSTNSAAIGGLNAATTYYYDVIAISGGTCSSSVSATYSLVTTTYNYNAITMTSGFNEDVIANSTLNPANGTLGTAGTSTGAYPGFDNANYVFVSSDYHYGTNVPNAGESLTVTGTLNSTITSGLQYQLGGYNADNALVMVASVNATSPALIFTTPQYANNLYILGTTGSGTAAGAYCKFTINYQDGTTQTSGTIQYYNWYSTVTATSGTTPATVDFKQLGRVNETTGGVDGTSTTGPYLFQAQLTPTYTASPIKSVNVATTPSFSTTAPAGGMLGIFAISARSGVVYPSVTSLTFGNANECGASAVQTFSITGSSLFATGTATAVVTASVSPGYQVSNNGTTWGASATYTVLGTNKLPTPSVVYVRFTPTSTATSSGTISFLGCGINNNPTVSLSGGAGVAGALTGSVTAICANGTTALTDPVAVGAITSGTWSSSASTIASVNTSGLVVGQSAGATVISYAYGCNSTIDVYSVTVNPTPTSTGPTYTAICAGNTLNLFANDAGASGYSWSGPAALASNTVENPVSASTVTSTANGVYSVTISNTFGCSIAAVTPSVSVNAQPSATVTPSTLNLCTGSVESLTSAITGGVGTPTYTWSGPGITGSTATGTTTTYSLIPTASSGSYSLAVSYSVSTGCATAAANTATVNITAPPAISAITPSSANVCSGSAFTLTATEAGGSGTAVYSWSGPALSTTTSSSNPFVFTPTVSAVTSGTYSVSVSFSGTGCGTSSVTTSSSVSINAQPTVSVSASPLALCSGGNLTLNTTSAGGSGTPVYTWSGPGIAVTTSTSTGSAVYTPTTATGAYTVSVVYSGAGCNAATATSSVVAVSDQPVVSVSTSVTGIICNGAPEVLSATITDGGSGTPTYTWGGPGITGSAGPYTSSTYTVTPTSSATAGAYSVAVSYSVSTGCNTAYNTTATVVPTNQQWTGAASNLWSNAANWACGSVPIATENVVIPAAAAYTNAPTLDVANGYAYNLTIGAAAVVTLNGTNQLSVADSITNNGTIGGGGSIYLNGSVPQVLSGNGVYSNLTLANSAGAKINTTSDTVGVTGELLLSAGTFTTNGSLMLLSDSCVVCSSSDSLINGYIGPIASGAGISGQVVIQQFVPRGVRAYRFIAHPFTSNVPLSQIEPFIDITGPGGTSEGFTSTITNAASAYWYNPLYGNSVDGNDPGWRSFKNTFAATGSDDTDQINRFEGIRLFVRGSKGQGLDGMTYTPNAVTYRTYGTVNTGTVYEPMIMGTASVSGTPSQRYNLLGNPYPAVTDIGSVINAANLAGKIYGASFYVWNPYIGPYGNGAFVTIPVGTVPYYLGANESFEVQTAGTYSLVFTESNKGSVVNAALMRTTSDQSVALNVYDASYHLWDMLTVQFNDAATDNEDAHYDGSKPPSPQMFSFYSLSADSVKLAVDSRPFSAGKVIPLGMASSYAQPLIIKAENVSAPAGGQVYLHDKLLETYTLLQTGTEYKFTITKDPATQGNKRFELSMNPTGVNAVASKNIDVQMVPNPATSEVTINYSFPSKAQTAIHVMNVEGVTVLTQDLGIQQSGSAKIALDKLASGVYMVEVTSGTDKVVNRLVKE